MHTVTGFTVYESHLLLFLGWGTSVGSAIFPTLSWASPEILIRSI